jgi:hypothetical protein
MSKAVNGIDWDLLNQQKVALLKMLGYKNDGTSQSKALWGIIHLLDALQDEAVEKGVWAFPDEEPAEESEVHDVEP